jgi:tape measure domain-containing protein
MAIIDELIAILGYDIRGEDNLRRFNAGIDGAERHARGAAQGIGLLGVAVGSFLGGMALEAVSRLTTAIKDIPAGVTKTGATFENLGIRLETLEGSSAKAETALAWVKQFAKDTPLGLADTADAYASLKNYGIDPTNGSLMALTDAMSASGKGTQQLGRLSLALGQAWVKQKLQGGEILQLTEAGIPVWDMLATATGKNVLELQKLSQAGKLGRTEIQLLIDEIGKKYAGASEKMARTYDGLVDKLGDSYQQFQLMVSDSGWFDFLKNKLDETEKYISEWLDTDQAKQWASTISRVMVGAVQLFQRWARAAWDSMKWIGDRFYDLGDIIADALRKLTGGDVDLTAMQALGAAFGVLAAWLFPVATLLVVAALALDDFITWMQGGDSAIGDFVAALPSIKQAFDDLLPGVRSAVQSMVALFQSGDWTGAGIMAAEAFSRGWSGLQALITPYVDQALNYISSIDWAGAINVGMASAIVSLQGVNWEGVGEAGGKLAAELATSIIAGLGQQLVDLNQVLRDIVKGDLSKIDLWEGGVASLIVESLKAQAGLITGAIRGMAEGIRQAVKDWFDVDLSGIGGRLAQSIWEGFKSYLPDWQSILWGDAADPNYDTREALRIDNGINRDRPRPVVELPPTDSRAARTADACHDKQ